jgi:hypothetical protein
MPVPKPQPWWEKPAKSPGQSGYEPERERLREALNRAWRNAHGGKATRAVSVTRSRQYVH